MRSTADELSALRNLIPWRGNGNTSSDHILTLLEQGIAAAAGAQSNVAGWGGDT